MTAAEGSAGRSPIPTEGPAWFRFCTDTLPEPERIGAFREALGQKMLRLDMEALSGHPFRSDVTVWAPPGLGIVWGDSSPLRVGRTRALVSDGNDSLVFQWANTAGFTEHLRRESMLRPGEGFVFSCSDPGHVSFPSPVRLVSVSVPRRALSPRLRATDDQLAKPLSADSVALQLLVGYLELLRAPSGMLCPALEALAVAHICDLLALTLGATRDEMEVAKNRGVRAARLAAIKQSIRENLSQVTLADVTERHRLGPRYVQMLFEEEGTTFTEFVIEERLAQARRMLASPRSAGRKIADIAFTCGFGDVSYFNRKFRQRFGSAPGELRNK